MGSARNVQLLRFNLTYDTQVLCEEHVPSLIFLAFSQELMSHGLPKAFIQLRMGVYTKYLDSYIMQFRGVLRSRITGWYLDIHPKVLE